SHSCERLTERDSSTRTLNIVYPSQVYTDTTSTAAPIRPSSRSARAAVQARATTPPIRIANCSAPSIAAETIRTAKEAVRRSSRTASPVISASRSVLAVLVDAMAPSWHRPRRRRRSDRRLPMPTGATFVGRPGTGGALPWPGGYRRLHRRAPAPVGPAPGADPQPDPRRGGCGRADVAVPGDRHASVHGALDQ